MANGHSSPDQQTWRGPDAGRADRGLEGAVINTFRDLEEKVHRLHEQRGNLNRYRNCEKEANRNTANAVITENKWFLWQVCWSTGLCWRQGEGDPEDRPTPVTEWRPGRTGQPGATASTE